MVRDITFSVWEALTFHRSVKCQRSDPDILVNLPLNDPEALRVCMARFHNLASAGGDKMLKIHCRDVVLEACLGQRCAFDGSKEAKRSSSLLLRCQSVVRGF